MAAGYSKTPLWKKLVLRPADSLLLLDAPDGWSVPDLPDGVRTLSETADAHAADKTDVVIAFFRTLAELRVGIPQLAPRIFPDGAIWAAWPRRAGGHQSDITEHDIRTAALPLGLIDVKVAALDHDWSGLRLVWRVERRKTS